MIPITALIEEIKQQLEKLIDEFKNVDIKVSNELAQALQLFQISASTAGH